MWGTGGCQPCALRRPGSQLAQKGHPGAGGITSSTPQTLGLCRSAPALSGKLQARTSPQPALAAQRAHSPTKGEGGFLFSQAPRRRTASPRGLASPAGLQPPPHR